MMIVIWLTTIIMIVGVTPSFVNLTIVFKMITIQIILLMQINNDNILFGNINNNHHAHNSDTKGGGVGVGIVFLLDEVWGNMGHQAHACTH